MYTKDSFKNQKDIMTGKISLPSFEELKAIERKCEREHDDAIWEVFSAPFKALRGILDYSGQGNQGLAGTV